MNNMPGWFPMVWMTAMNIAGWLVALGIFIGSHRALAARVKRVEDRQDESDRDNRDRGELLARLDATLKGLQDVFRQFQGTMADIRREIHDR